MSEKRFHQFGLWVIDDPNLKINTVADLFDTKIMSIEEVVDLLNEQQSTIEMYQRRVDKREEQISTIKRCCLRFLNDEQIQIIEKELGYE